MKIQANQLSSRLQSGLSPCYLVTGDEHLLLDESLDQIRTAARAAGFTARDLYVATTGFDWGQLAQAGANLSLFAERRIVELRLPTGKPGRVGSKAIVDLLDRLGDDLLLIVSTPKLDRSNQNAKWVKSLSEAGVHVPIWPVAVRELPGWIAARMRAAGLTADRDAVNVIADRVEGNLLAASQEVEKLRLILGEGNVSADDVAEVVANSSRFDVFKLVDAALAGDAPRCVKILSGLRAEGTECVIVVWALTREVRVLAHLSENVAAGLDLGTAMQKAGVWRTRQALVRSAVSRHPTAHYRALLKAAGRADRAAKGQSGEDPWQRVTDVTLALALSPRRAA
ncbi:MAG: DNA polymerase III subunit delta [Pseudomonadota bacterium]